MTKQKDKEAFFSDRYMDTVNRGLIGKVSHLLHKLLELNLGSANNNNHLRIVEVGAVQGQHFNYVKGNHSEYLEIDLRPRTLQIAAQHQPTEPLQDSTNRIFVQSDCSDLLFLNDDSVDRVIATCLLVHLTDPE